jgi:hypothetical protein
MVAYNRLGWQSRDNNLLRYLINYTVFKLLNQLPFRHQNSTLLRPPQIQRQQPLQNLLIGQIARPAISHEDDLPTYITPPTRTALPHPAYPSP